MPFPSDQPGRPATTGDRPALPRGLAPAVDPAVQAPGRATGPAAEAAGASAVEQRAAGGTSWTQATAPTAGSTCTAACTATGPAAGASRESRVTAAGAGGAGALSATAAAASTGTGAGAAPNAGTTNAGAFTGALAALALAPGTVVPALPVRLRVHADEAYAKPPVCCGHPFGPGDVPAGHRVRLRTAAGAEIPVQQDAESHWPDGSLRFAVLSFMAPDSFAAGQTVSYTVDAAPGSPDRGTGVTVRTLAAEHDFKVRVSGFTWGANAGAMRVNDVIAAVGGAVGSWGRNPTMGIEQVASGPIRSEYRVWGAAKRESDGALHESVRLELYIRRWNATGAYEILGRQRQPNFDAPYGGGAWSTTGWSQGNVGIFECFDGATRVFAAGGPNDRDARTVPASAFDASRSMYRVPVGQNLGQAVGIGQGLGNADTWTGMGVPFGMSGNLPGGTSPNTPYWLSGLDSNRWAGLRNARNRNDPPSFVIFSRPASGTVRTFPLFHSYPGTGSVAADEQGLPFWVGAGARPRVFAGHDEAYLTRATRLVAPMDLTQPRPAEPPCATDGGEWDFHPHRPGQVLSSRIWDWGDASDDWYADRIGWLSRQHANLVLTPFDRRRRTHCYALAYSQGDIHWDFEDRRSGRVPVVNNGPDGRGASYPQMAPPLPNIFFTNRDTQGPQSSNPGFVAMANYNTGGSGYAPRYNPVCDGSHNPMWQLVPYLQSGQQVFLDILRTNTACLWASHDRYRRQTVLNPPVVPAGRKFWSCLWDQDRANGWARYALSTLRYFLPEAHPERAYFDDVAKDDAEWWGAIAPLSPNARFGHVPPAPNDGNMANYVTRPTDEHNCGFQSIYQAFGTMMCIYRGDAAWRPVAEVYLAFLRDCADDRQAPNGTGFFTGIYFAHIVQRGRVSTSRQDWIERSALYEGDWGNPCPKVPPPYPANRNWAGNLWASGDPRRDPPPSSYATRYDVQQCAALALADWLGYPGCKRVRSQILNRIIAHPNGHPAVRDRFPLSSLDNPYMMALQWSVLPTGT